MRAELDFATDFAKNAGSYLLQKHGEALDSQKLDRKMVTELGIELNERFIPGVRSNFGAFVAVLGKEASTQDVLEQEGPCWVIDPTDGAAEFGNPKLPAQERTSCIGIAMFLDGKPKLSVAYNPFRKWLFTATDDGIARLNGGVMATLPDTVHSIVAPGMPYDFSYWEDCMVDLRPLEKALGQSRRNDSAISQACDVALGESAFAVFPGNKIHDVAPAALMVKQAGGVVSDLRGRPLQWDALNGAVYSCNPVIHREVLRIVEVHR